MHIAIDFSRNGKPFAELSIRSLDRAARKRQWSNLRAWTLAVRYEIVFVPMTS